MNHQAALSLLNDRAPGVRLLRFGAGLCAAKCGLKGQ